MPTGVERNEGMVGLEVEAYLYFLDILNKRLLTLS